MQKTGLKLIAVIAITIMTVFSGKAESGEWVGDCFYLSPLPGDDGASCRSWVTSLCNSFNSSTICKADCKTDGHNRCDTTYPDETCWWWQPSCNASETPPVDPES